MSMTARQHSSLSQEWKDEEEAVLRDCFVIMQGMDGDRLSWKLWEESAMMHPQHLLAEEKLCLKSPVLARDLTTLLPASLLAQSRLGSDAHDALSICGEAGWLYRRVQLYIDGVQQNLGAGPIARALACALQQELRDYLRFLNHLEQQIDQLHLRQILIRTKPVTRTLQKLAMLTDSLQHLQGGPLLAELQKHVRHGDARHVELVNRLLTAASRPWFQMLHQWTAFGSLSDPAQEFFVRLNDDKPSTSCSSTNELFVSRGTFEWKDGFVLDLQKLPGPGIMDNDLVEPAFRVGKGVNFVRRCLMDGEWTFDQDFLDRAKKAFGYNPQASDSKVVFRSTLTEAMRTVHSHILKALHRDHHLMQHLYALKQFMFLGQGDFYSVLVEGLTAEFGEKCGVTGIYRHTLAAVVETALRNTNANNFPSHILDRLEIDWDVEDQDLQYAFDSAVITASDKNDQRRIWDIFGLDYAVPEALSSIVTEEAKADYRLVFKSLFGLKTVEHHLNSTWRTSATLQHVLHAIAQQNGLTVGTDRAYAQAMALLRQIAMARQSMMHFVTNYKTYIMFEVLEGGWKKLSQDINHAETLDAVVAAHSRYVRDICRKSLLRHQQNDLETSSRSDRDTKLGDLIVELLGLCNEFCIYQQTLFSKALEDADRAREKRREANARAEQGTWGFASEDILKEEMDFFGLADSVKLTDFAVLTRSFHEKIVDLLSCADEVLNGVSMAALRTPTTFSPATPDNPSQQQESGRPGDALDSLRFLVFQLDQNRFYDLHYQLSK